MRRACVAFVAAAALFEPAACAPEASSTLPVLRPRKNTIACADPLAAQDFTLKYIGGLWTEQLVDGGNGSCADIKWVDFTPDDPANANNTQFHWHFVETSRKPTGPMSLIQLHGYLEWLHGNLSTAANPDDDMADSHMTLAAGSLDPFATLYARDRLDFSARARVIAGASNLTLYSVLVEIPHGILVEIVSDTYDAALFRAHGGIAAADDDPCAPRHIPTATGAYFDRLRALAPFSAEGLPPVWPYSMSYASTKPSDAAAFVEQYMGGTVVDQELPAECDASIRFGLAEFVGSTPYPFYVQFLYHPAARSGYFPLERVETYLEALHGNISEDHYDQYMDDHLGMEAVVRGDDSFGAFLDVWRASDVEWFHRMASWDGVDSFLNSPGGIILEVMVAEANGTAFGLPLVNWDICSPLPPMPRIAMPDAPLTHRR